jgi:hypothetical protein
MRCRGQKRTEEISFKVSSDEKAVITAAAKLRKMTVASLVRNSLLKEGCKVEAPKEKSKAIKRPAPKVDRELMLEVAKISNGLDLIASWVKELEDDESVVLVLLALIAFDQTLCDVVHGRMAYRK